MMDIANIWQCDIRNDLGVINCCIVREVKDSFSFLSLLVAANEVHNAATVEKLEVPCPRKRNNRCRHPKLGKQKSEECRQKISNGKL